MKKILPILWLSTISVQACGPYFPPSYIGDLNSNLFHENINLPVELQLLAREYNLIDDTLFPTGQVSAVQADQSEFTRRATALGAEEQIAAYAAYADACRNNCAAIPPQNLPAQLYEFTLYLEGVRQMKNDPELIAPPAWVALLELSETNRQYRTTWAHYMLGNLAASHQKPALASEHYTACRQAVRHKFHDALGLAAASYKREFLAQTNTADRIRCGVQAVGYYQQAENSKKMVHCFEHLIKDFNHPHAGSRPLTEEHLGTPICLEATTLLWRGKQTPPKSVDLVQRLKKEPPLKITPRLAWFLYRRGEIDRAASYLESCPEDDVLANWLRFRIAQRNGDTPGAIDHLQLWLEKIQNSDRVVFGFSHFWNNSPSKPNTLGILGSLLVTQGQMQDALVCFVDAGAHQDAALVAERYIDTATLQAYIDSFNLPPADARKHPAYARHFYKAEDPEKQKESVQRQLTYLLARRLFREGHLSEALPYYPEEIAEIAKTYQSAHAKSDLRWSVSNLRSAHLFHAARIMRWHGLELCGTELYPDYKIVDGDFPCYGFIDEKLTSPINLSVFYNKTAPTPELRFHYRYLAADLAGKAAAMAKNRHQRATILWCAGQWIQLRAPKPADVHYKNLARIHFQPLAAAADKLRWFPPGTPALKAVYCNKKYLSPAELTQASKKYKKPAP